MTTVSHNRQIALEAALKSLKVALKYCENRPVDALEVIEVAAIFEEFLRNGGHHHLPQRDKGG